ncbi:glucokinase [Maritalea sp.]|uniref:glucokinase n=1 Tax=Maritalea sp. TaxID=2003361 RepID=UPI003EF5AC1B
MSEVSALVADVGGTNTRFGLVVEQGGQPTNCVKVLNSSYASFADAAMDYLSTNKQVRPAHVCLSIAAPIQGNVVPMTNCNWVIDLDRVKSTVGSNTAEAINDFEALGFALNRLPQGSAEHISGPSNKSDPRKMIVGAGTGFNAATSVTLANGNCYVLPAECGHMTLSVETEVEWKLRHILATKYTRASVERVLSGEGIQAAYRLSCAHLCCETKNYTSKQVTQAAIEKRDAPSALAVKIVVGVLARTVGDLALVNLPLGGIYLYGGVTRALSNWIELAEFREMFEAKGRQTALMRDFPIHIVTEDNIGIVGCAAYMAQCNPTLTPHG